MLILEQQVVETLRRLPETQQQEVLAFIKRMEQQSAPRTPLQRIKELTADIPAEVWERIPQDGAEQDDHYLYGSPKR